MKTIVLQKVKQRDHKIHQSFTQSVWFQTDDLTHHHEDIHNRDDDIGDAEHGYRRTHEECHRAGSHCCEHEVEFIEEKRAGVRPQARHEVNDRHKENHGQSFNRQHIAEDFGKKVNRHTIEPGRVFVSTKENDDFPFTRQIFDGELKRIKKKHNRRR